MPNFYTAARQFPFVVVVFRDHEVVVRQGKFPPSLDWAHVCGFVYTKGGFFSVLKDRDENAQQLPARYLTQTAAVQALRDRLPKTPPAENLQKELEERLRGFDWYADYSDDGAVYRRSLQDWDEIKMLMSLLPADVAQETLNRYRPAQD